MKNLMKFYKLIYILPIQFRAPKSQMVTMQDQEAEAESICPLHYSHLPTTASCVASQGDR